MLGPWGVPAPYAGLTTSQMNQTLRDDKLRDECRSLFTSQQALLDLRESSPLGKPPSPSWADYEHMKMYTDSLWGTGAEALALTLWHLASVKGWSGKKIDRYRDAAEFAW